MANLLDYGDEDWKRSADDEFDGTKEGGTVDAIP